jgi:hypothetical protein
MFSNSFKKEKILFNFSNSYLRDRLRLSNFFVNSSKNLPEWYKSLPTKKLIDMVGKIFILNAKTCPSFVDIFKNSMTFISPSDIMIEYGKSGMKFSTPEPGYEWFLIESHTWKRVDTNTYIRDKSANQMGELWGEGIHNIKIGTPVWFCTKYNKAKVIFMPNMYYNQKSELSVAPGVLELIPKEPMRISVNFFVDVSNLGPSETKTILIKKGEPLAMLYFPSGLHEFEKTDIHGGFRSKFYGNWLSKIREYDKKQETKKKCPFRF